MKKLRNGMIIILCSLTMISFGQPAHKDTISEAKRDQIKAHKVAFITEKLELTPEEAQRFWPVYNEYEKKRHELVESERKDLEKAKENFDTMSDDEVKQMMTGHFKIEEEKLSLHKQYHDKFLEVLPVKKVAKLYHAEHMFKRRLLRHHMKGMEGHPGHEGHPMK